MEALDALAGERPDGVAPKSPTKSGKPAKPAEVPSTETTSGAEAAEPAKEDGKLTKDTVRAALLAFQEEHGADKTKELIKPFGLTIGKIKAKDYQAVIDAINDDS